MSPPDCSLLVGQAQDVCITLYPPGCAVNEFTNSTGSCVPYESRLAKAAALEGDQAALNSGNIAWMLAATALVMIMTPGLGLFYAGLSGERSAANTILMSFVSMAIVSVQWFLFGYSFAFAPNLPGWGSFAWACLLPIGMKPSGLYGYGIPHLLFVAFQCQFAQITPALISGAVIGRMKFYVYVIFIFIWTSLIYDALAHWVWSWYFNDAWELKPEGFLGSLGAIDYAGGTVIHISSGFSALAAALVLGKTKAGKTQPHNVPMVVIGTSFLWFGWFGFNAGSAVEASGKAATAFINTHLAASSAALTWMVVEKIAGKQPSAIGACSGAVAGLVAITPACGFVLPWHAIIFGIIVSPISYGFIVLKEKIGYDDTLDVFAIHGMGGVTGALLTGLFATTQVNFIDGAFYGNGPLFGYQLAEVVVAAVYSFFGTGAILLILKATLGIRISEENEKAGIDASEHGGAAYGS